MHKDRFGYTLFLSISFHLIILIGLSLEIAQTKGVNLGPNLTNNSKVKNFSVELKGLALQMGSRPNLDSMIVELKKKISDHNQDLKTRPRRDTITAVSAHSKQTLYLEKWLDRVEEVGNSHYPDEARKNKIFGSLRILVAIRVDGHVEDFRIMESSGSQILDEAAEKIVELAAPFDPLPEEISFETDILEIVRTWRFHEGISLKSTE